METINLSNDTILTTEKGIINYLFSYELAGIIDYLPARLTQLFDVSTSLGSCGDNNVLLNKIEHKDNCIEMQYSLFNGEIFYNIEILYHEEFSLLKRKDTIVNNSSKNIVITKAVANYAFLEEDMQVYSQNSSWAKESDGAFRPLDQIHMQSEGGRSSQGATPYIAFKSPNKTHGIAFHIIPVGDYEINVKTASLGVGRPFGYAKQLQIGHLSDKMYKSIAPDESLELPELLIQKLENGSLASGAYQLHKYFIETDVNRHKKTHPMVYNPWFDNYANLDNTTRLLEHLQTAKELGCEVFEIDAGWYGSKEGDWQEQVGDWQERTHGAFKGHMADFAKKVNDQGLGFGLWMEPERIAENTPIRQAKPHLFEKGFGYYYPKVYTDEGFEYLYNEIKTLIIKYNLVWMKFDFNFELGVDTLGENFYSYYKSWYNLLDKLRTDFTSTFFEGCSAGCMRLDINTVHHFDAHFLSDNVNPYTMLNIYCNTILRVQPYKIIKWLVLAPGANIRTYSSIEPISTAITPKNPGAGIDGYENIDVDFACMVASSGLMGLSGNFIDLTPKQKDKVKAHIAFYKEYRNFYKDCAVYIDSPIPMVEQRKGFVSLQFCNVYNGNSILFVFKYISNIHNKKVNLKDIDEDKIYHIKGGDCDYEIDGKTLKREGITVSLGSDTAIRLHITIKN